MSCTKCGCQTHPVIADCGASVLYRLARKIRLGGHMLFVMRDGKTFRQVMADSHKDFTKVISGVNKTVRFDRQELWLSSVSETEPEVLYVEVKSSGDS